jgi:hypothetical protein
VRLLARFMKAAQAVFQRIAPMSTKAKRSGKGKARGASGRLPHQLRADRSRAANREAKIQRLKQPKTTAKAKGEPKRPPAPPKPTPEL